MGRSLSIRIKGKLIVEIKIIISSYLLQIKFKCTDNVIKKNYTVIQFYIATLANMVESDITPTT